MTSTIRRGGYRQQQLAEARERSRSPCQGGAPANRSELCCELLADWAWGQSSAQRVGEKARAGVTDGIKCKDLAKLAKIGGQVLSQARIIQRET